MEFWIAVGVLWLVFGRGMMWSGGGRRGSGWGGSRRDRCEERRDRFAELRWRRRHGWSEDDDAAWEGRWRGQDAPHRRRKPEDRSPETKAIATDPVAKLQREWVDGKLTDGEYEQALDKVYSSRVSGGAERVN